MDENEKFLVDFGETTVVGGGGGTTDFNELINRPKYNNNTMTGSTNIPKVPTKTSDLTNDSNFVVSSSLATVATTGAYSDLSGTPTIPVVNNATLTVTQNGTSVGTFTANSSTDTTIAVKDTTYSAFTGTDGTAAGTAGLVPAPATTDAGKFLKADGTWDTAGGGGGGSSVIELTSADYNYPDNNPDGVALWKLDGGLYKAVNAKVYFNTSTSTTNDGKTFLVLKQPGLDSSVKRTGIISQDSSGAALVYSTYTNSGVADVSGLSIGGPTVEQTTGTSTLRVMSQNAVTSMVFSDPSTQRIVRIGNTNTSGFQSVSIGVGAGASVNESIAIGANAMANGAATLALGSSSTATQAGEISFPYCRSGGASGVVNFGPYNASFGYNNSKYRLLSGIYDGQSAHDAVTVEQVNATIDAINTAFSTNIPHIGANS